MTEHKVYHQQIADLVTSAGFDPRDVRSFHAEYGNVWAEVLVRDEKGNLVLNADRDDVATTVVPVRWVAGSEFYDEEELKHV